jgi:hypothetical protein
MVRVDPNAESFFIGQSAVGDFHRYQAVLVLSLRDERTATGPTTMAIDDSKHPCYVGVRLDQDRLEESIIGFNLSLEFLVFAWLKARLILVW